MIYDLEKQAFFALKVLFWVLKRPFQGKQHGLLVLLRFQREIGAGG